MAAVLDGKTVRVSPDIAKALTGAYEGYTVQLHGLPGYTFHVDAGCVDDAHRAALTVAQREGRCVKATGATVRRGV